MVAYAMQHLLASLMGTFLTFCPRPVFQLANERGFKILSVDEHAVRVEGDGGRWHVWDMRLDDFALVVAREAEQPLVFLRGWLEYDKDTDRIEMRRFQRPLF
jgi:hypothetical protein